VAQSLILSIGADGRFASLVIPELVRRGAHVRGFVQKAEKADIAKAKGASEIAFGDLSDLASLDTALKGVEARTDLARAHHLAPSEALGSDATGRRRHAPQSSPTASGALSFLNDGELLRPCSRFSGGRRGRVDQRSSPVRDSG